MPLRETGTNTHSDGREGRWGAVDGLVWDTADRKSMSLVILWQLEPDSATAAKTWSESQNDCEESARYWPVVLRVFSSLLFFPNNLTLVSSSQKHSSSTYVECWSRLSCHCMCGCQQTDRLFPAVCIFHCTSSVGNTTMRNINIYVSLDFLETFLFKENKSAEMVCTFSFLYNYNNVYNICQPLSRTRDEV